MNKLFLLFLLPFITFGRQPEHTGELIIDLINRGSSWNVTFTLTAIGARWDENYDLTGDYGTASDNVSSPVLAAYFDHILASGDNPVYAVGFYKIKAIENGVEQAYFYMDWRTSDWSVSLDVYFKYDVGNNRFRNSGNTQTIDYSVQTLWDLTDNLLETSGLEDYWGNALVVTNNGSNKPRLIWGPYPGSGISNYKIYRDDGSGFSNIATVNSSTFNYTDNSVTISQPGQTIYYKVKPEVPSEASLPYTNTVSTTVIPFKQKSKNSSNFYTFSLMQNYPNPFNPSTRISYEIPENAKVQIKVYDMLGTEVAELVNETKPAGFYEITFDGSDLSSGVYIYRITALSGDKILFNQSKQMILLK